MKVLGDFNPFQHLWNNTGLQVYYVFRSYNLYIKRLYFRDYNNIFYPMIQLIVAFQNFANAPENAIYCPPPVCSTHTLYSYAYLWMQ